MQQNLALVLGLGGKYAESRSVARAALPADKATSNVAYLQKPPKPAPLPPSIRRPATKPIPRPPAPVLHRRPISSAPGPQTPSKRRAAPLFLRPATVAAAQPQIEPLRNPPSVPETLRSRARHYPGSFPAAVLLVLSAHCFGHEDPGSPCLQGAPSGDADLEQVWRAPSRFQFSLSWKRARAGSLLSSRPCLPSDLFRGCPGSISQLAGACESLDPATSAGMTSWISGST